MKDPRGSKTEITNVMIESLPELVVAGCTFHDIVSILGLSRTQVVAWDASVSELPLDAEWESIPSDLQQFMVFKLAHERAMLDLKTSLFRRVYAGDRTWGSAALLLKVKFPEEYNVLAGAEFEPLESRAPTTEEKKALGLMAEAESESTVPDPEVEPADPE